MVEDKEQKHRNKLNRISDAEIMVILILVHSGGFRGFKHYLCKHLKHLFRARFPMTVFVIPEKEVPLPLTVSIKKAPVDKGYIGQALFENLFLEWHTACH